MSKYSELLDSATRLLESKGHKIIDWHEYSNHRYSGFYTGRNDNTNAYGNCDYCKTSISIDLYPKAGESQIQGDMLLSDCIAKNMTKDETGIAAITYDTCWKCNKKISPRNKTEVKRGVHNKCLSDADCNMVILDVRTNKMYVAVKLL